MSVAAKGVPYITTHDGRTIRYPDPNVKVNDTVMVDIATGKIKEYIKFEPGETLLLCLLLSMAGWSLYVRSSVQVERMQPVVSDSLVCKMVNNWVNQIVYQVSGCT